MRVSRRIRWWGALGVMLFAFAANGCGGSGKALIPIEEKPSGTWNDMRWNQGVWR